MTDKQNRAKYHKIYCSPFNCLFNAKRLSEEELHDIIGEVSDMINEGKFSDMAFRKFIVENLVVGWEKIKDKLRDKYKDITLMELYCEFYESVITVYQIFEVESVVKAVNMHDFQQAFDEDSVAFLKEDKSGCHSLRDFENAEKKIKKAVIGQDEAVETSLQALKLIRANLEKTASLFFIGPTGVGKTELSKKIAEVAFGSKKKMLKINCGEYSAQHEYAKLLGSPPGYIGHETGSILGNAAEKSSEWVIVFDEIEKAHDKLYDVILNLLDEGEVTDSKGHILDFSRSLVIFTSNIGLRDHVGKKQVGFNSSETTYQEVEEQINDAYRNKFSPEFRNRIDYVVRFKQLGEREARKIARIHLGKLPVKVDAKLVNYVVREGFSAEYGARNLKRTIKSEIAPKIADSILSGDADKSFQAVFKDKNLVGLSAI